MNELEQLKRRVNDLEQLVKALANNTTIPFNVEKAFSSRLGITNLQTKLYDGGDLPSNYSETVNEGGVASHSVLREPDYILRAKYRHLAVAIPAYDI
jgi:hypothetical protein